MGMSNPHTCGGKGDSSRRLVQNSTPQCLRSVGPRLTFSSCHVIYCLLGIKVNKKNHCFLTVDTFFSCFSPRKVERKGRESGLAMEDSSRVHFRFGTTVKKQKLRPVKRYAVVASKEWFGGAETGVEISGWAPLFSSCPPQFSTGKASEVLRTRTTLTSHPPTLLHNGRSPICFPSP